MRSRSEQNKIIGKKSKTHFQGGEGFLSILPSSLPPSFLEISHHTRNKQNKNLPQIKFLQQIGFYAFFCFLFTFFSRWWV